MKKLFRSKQFLTYTGAAAGACWIIKDQFPEGSLLKNLCVGIVGLGLFLGTWSSTTPATKKDT